MWYLYPLSAEIAVYVCRSHAYTDPWGAFLGGRALEGPLEILGVEDPHVVELDGTCYVRYTTYGTDGGRDGTITPMFARSDNLIVWDRIGPLVRGEDNKDHSLLPHNLQGRFVAFHRSPPPSIWLAESDDDHITAWKFVFSTSRTRASSSIGLLSRSSNPSRSGSCMVPCPTSCFRRRARSWTERSTCTTEPRTGYLSWPRRRSTNSLSLPALAEPDRQGSSAGRRDTDASVATLSRMVDLYKYITDVPDFPEQGIVFKDITPLLASPTAFLQAVDEMAEPFIDSRVDIVVGIESRGFLLAGSIAERIGSGVGLVRKPGKLPRDTVSVTYDLEYGTDTLEIHADAFSGGDRVLIVDDVLATGGTLAASKELVEKAGGSVLGATILLELSFLNGRARFDGLLHVVLVY